MLTILTILCAFIFPHGCYQMEDGVWRWQVPSGEGWTVPTSERPATAQIDVGHAILNRLVLTGFHGSGMRPAAVYVTVSQSTPLYGVYAAITLHNEQGNLSIELWPSDDEMFPLDGGSVTIKYEIDADISSWVKWDVVISIGSPLLETTFVSIEDVHIR